MLKIWLLFLKNVLIITDNCAIGTDVLIERYFREKIQLQESLQRKEVTLIRMRVFSI